MEIIALILFLGILVLVLLGYPVAFVLGGLSVLVGAIFLGVDFFLLLPSRFIGVMSNYVLIAVPLFVFMGVMLEKSGLAERLLLTMGRLFSGIGGGLAVSTIVVGTLLAASTGIVGATVVCMGLISLPVMIRNKYDGSLAAGVIASSGTLGQIIPPSIVLVLLGSVLNVSVGKLFAAALGPGLLLIGGYILYIAIMARLSPQKLPKLESTGDKVRLKDVLISFAMPLVLIISVLGAIFSGIASPTEAAAIGAIGAMLITVLSGKMNFKVLRSVVDETTHITVMVFFILLGATTFSLVFRGLGGDSFIVDMIEQSNVHSSVFLLGVMLLIFVIGFFIDFIEIIFIIVPVVAPIFIQMEMDLIWIGILIALNLQTSFLTPPFGFSLFYLKGVSKDLVTTKQIYKGVLPFLFIQLVVMLLVAFFPEMIGIFSFK